MIIDYQSSITTQIILHLTDLLLNSSLTRVLRLIRSNVDDNRVGVLPNLIQFIIAVQTRLRSAVH